jgi:hypothetical protein
LNPIGTPLVVIVRNKDGEPERGASVLFATKNNPGYIYSNMNFRGNKDTVVLTNDEGRAQLPGSDKRFTIAALSK